MTRLPLEFTTRAGGTLRVYTSAPGTARIEFVSPGNATLAVDMRQDGARVIAAALLAWANEQEKQG